MYIFKSTLNTRPILENSIKFIRSDVPTKITDDEKQWMLSNDVITIIDLRTDEERNEKFCPLMDDIRFSYYAFSITGGSKVPLNTKDVPVSYIGMVDDKFNETIEFMLNTKSNVLYFCNAGKDRTGVVSAVLLHKLGMPLEYIVDDYLKSKYNLETMLIEYAKQNPVVDIDVIVPNKQYIEEFLKWYINFERK